jgi:MFS family permease
VPEVSNEKLPASNYGQSNALASELVATAINPRLIQLNVGIFISHLLLTMLFLVVPRMIVEVGGYALETHWQVYVPVLFLSALGMVPLIRAASKRTHVSMAYRISISLVLISFAVLSFSHIFSFLWIWIGMVMFFSGFNALEAMLPSLVSQQVPSQVRGMAMGVYNTFQFSGIFIGGVFGGWIMGLYGEYGVMGFALGITIVWLVLSMLLPKFQLTRSISLNLNPMNDSQRDQLIDKIKHLNGIRDISIIGVDPVLYLEVEDEFYNDTELQQLIRT